MFSLPRDESLDEGNPVTVVFRRYKADNPGIAAGTCFALFPFIEGTKEENSCLSYQHVGQHGSADYFYCIENSDPCDPAHEACAALFLELSDMGYDMNVFSHEEVCYEAGRADLLKEQKKEKEDFSNCPACGIDGNIEGGPVNIEDSGAVQECSCTECNAQWLEWYKSDVRVLVEAGSVPFPVAGTKESNRA